MQSMDLNMDITKSVFHNEIGYNQVLSANKDEWQITRQVANPFVSIKELFTLGVKAKGT